MAKYPVQSLKNFKEWENEDLAKVLKRELFDMNRDELYDVSWAAMKEILGGRCFSEELFQVMSSQEAQKMVSRTH